MGYNTSFMLLNDDVHSLKDDPNVGTALYEMTLDLTGPKEHHRHRFGYKGIQAIHTAHADCSQIVEIGGNCGKVVAISYSAVSIIEAAVKLSKTTDPKERRKLIATIQREANFMGPLYPKRTFTL